MAAGLGFKTFTTGEVLTAADVNGYLNSQTVMVFADAAARTAAITSPQEGMITYLKDTNATQYYSGSAWVAVGAASPLTTKGDIYTYSTTDARLAVGTNGQALVADSTAATGLKWGSVASGLTLISRTSFSSQATQSFSGVFTSGYGSYRVIIESLYSSDPAGNLQMLMRTSGGQVTADYAWSRVDTYTGSTYNYSSSGTSFIIAPGAGRSSDRSAGTYDIMDAGAGNIRPHILGHHTCADDPSWRNTLFGGTVNNNTVTYTGFDLKSSLGNLTGTVSIYGLAL